MRDGGEKEGKAKLESEHRARGWDAPLVVRPRLANESAGNWANAIVEDTPPIRITLTQVMRVASAPPE